MSCKVLYVVAFFAWGLALVQKTPLAFLSPSATNTLFGFAVGVTIGAIVTWFANGGTLASRA